MIFFMDLKSFTLEKMFNRLAVSTYRKNYFLYDNFIKE